MPVSLAHAVISVESNYRPNTRGSAGEIGLMQIKPATARMMGYTGSASGLFNPETNIKYGMKYLGMAHQLSGGTTCGTILRYNAGHAARRMNPVSAAYCSKVKRAPGRLALIRDPRGARRGFRLRFSQQTPLSPCQPAGRPHPRQPKGCG